MKSLKQLAEEALQVQDACNLSGVVHGFSRAVHDLRENLPGVGTDAINRHPISKLWAYKIHALSLGECLCQWCSDKWEEADKACREIAAS